MEVVLYEPEIPPNTGNIARLCAVSGTRLHLIEPLGFRLEDRYLKRAGLDYWPHVRMDVWPDYGAFLKDAAATRPGARVVLTSAHPGGMPIQRFPFRTDDILVFGPGDQGTPQGHAGGCRVQGANPHAQGPRPVHQSVHELWDRALRRTRTERGAGRP